MDATSLSPSVTVEAVVPYQPRETRSQQERLTKADAGDLEARLALVPLEVVERVLARRFRPHEPDQSLLSYLREPGADVASHEAAATVLEELADQTEQSASDTMMVYRYIQAKGLWKGHPHPGVASAEGLVESLDACNVVRANIVIGASAQSGKRHCIQLIADIWEPDWFAHVLEAMPGTGLHVPEDCSHRLLIQMAATAKQGISLRDAVESWRAARHDRTDYARRRDLKIQGPTTPALIPRDVAPPSRVTDTRARGRRTTEVFFPDDAKEDELRVELVVPATSKPAPLSLPLNYHEAGRATTSGRKRKRGEGEEDDLGGALGATDEQWVRAADGLSESRRKKNQIIRRPLPDSSTAEQAQAEASSQLQAEAAASPEEPVRPVVARCEGPRLAKFFTQLVRSMQQTDFILPTLPERVAGTCDDCHEPAKNAWELLRGPLRAYAVEMRQVTRHRSNGCDIPIFPADGPLRREAEEGHTEDDDGDGDEETAAEEEEGEEEEEPDSPSLFVSDT